MSWVGWLFLLALFAYGTVERGLAGDVENAVCAAVGVGWCFWELWRR